MAEVGVCELLLGEMVMVNWGSLRRFLTNLRKVVDEEVSTIWARVGFVASFSRFHLASHLQKGLYRQPGGVVTLRSLLQSERIISKFLKS